MRVCLPLQLALQKLCWSSEGENSLSQNAEVPQGPVINIFPFCRVQKAVERAGNGNVGNTNSEMIQLGIQLRKDNVFVHYVSTCHSHPAFGTQNVHWVCSRCSSGVLQVVTRLEHLCEATPPCPL